MTQLSCAKLAKLYEKNPKRAKQLIQEVIVHNEATHRHILWGRAVRRGKMTYNAFIPSFYAIGPDHRRVQVMVRLRRTHILPITEGAKPKEKVLSKTNDIRDAIRDGFKVVGIRLVDALDSYRIRLPTALLRALERVIWKSLLEDIEALKVLKMKTLFEE